MRLLVLYFFLFLAESSPCELNSGPQVLGIEEGISDGEKAPGNKQCPVNAEPETLARTQRSLDPFNGEEPKETKNRKLDIKSNSTQSNPTPNQADKTDGHSNTEAKLGVSLDSPDGAIEKRLHIAGKENLQSSLSLQKGGSTASSSVHIISGPKVTSGAGPYVSNPRDKRYVLFGILEAVSVLLCRIFK